MCKRCHKSKDTFTAAYLHNYNLALINVKDKFSCAKEGLIWNVLKSGPL